MLRPDATSGYSASEGLYNWPVHEFTIGDVIRKTRIARRWSQTKLGTEAAYFQFGTGTLPINKSTVSKVEHEPYTSEFGTVWRLLAALNLTFADVERRIGTPFTERRRASTRQAARDEAPSEAAEKRGRKSTGRL
jgi:transcriptional regulator with XRE-family HTH domain